MVVFESGVIIFGWQTVAALIRERMSVLSDRQLKKLSEHKYKREGGLTLLEPLLNPFWNWTVERCPLWWAPNAITFIGLMVNVITALLIICYNPDGTGHVSETYCKMQPMCEYSWCFLNFAGKNMFQLFVYQTIVLLLETRLLNTIQISSCSCVLLSIFRL